MKLFWGAKAKKRAANFRGLLSCILDGMQNERWPSCEDVVMKEIDVIISVSEKDFASFEQDFNYEELALNVLKNLTLELVSSGRYHVYRGVLNPLGEQLKSVCCKAASRAKEKNYLSDEDYREFMDQLSYGIKTFG